MRDGSIEDLYYEIGYNGIHTTRVFIAAMVLPLIWVSGWMQSLRDHRRNWRRAQNLCATCTYNLTGNTSGICPECGTAIPAKTDVPLSEIAG